MADEARAMVLRSINLPADVDERLRTMAFVLRRPKSELIRAFIDQGLRQVAARIEKQPTDQLIGEIVAELDGAAFTARERAAFDRDIRRLQEAAA